MTLIDLEQKYTLERGKVFLNGIQALVRLPMLQIQRDRKSGINTTAFISGYRGSPLGHYDIQLAKAKRYLDQFGIVVRPGVNEDLAATAIWGSQQLQLSPGAKYDGVVGIWYGKGPGVDRSGDVFKHGNAAGTAKHGGVLCLAGDDHGAKSSSIPHQSDHAFMSALMPMLYPSSIHEFMEMGLLGIAMSRYSGCWVGMKLISDTVEATAAVTIPDPSHQFIIPQDFELPEGGLNLRWPDDRWSQDARLQNYKGYAAREFARINQVDLTTFDSPNARLGIVASGKAFEDVRQAFRELEIDENAAHDFGLRLYKVRMPWPLEPEGIRQFSVGLQEILIVEERRAIIENQIKQQLFNWRADVRPRIIGKFDHNDEHVLSLNEELTVGAVTRAIADRILDLTIPDDLRAHITQRLQWFEHRALLREQYQGISSRLPYYCPGCPHNTSTKVPEGSRAIAGIGCHFMVQWMDRNTELITQMGGEGVSWTGTAPFTDEKHLFINLGDGTYFHSGNLAIRQAVASGANVTYKILYNDAVAMTGGQAVDGILTPEQITHQLYHEGVRPIYLLSEAPEVYQQKDLAPNTILLHRDEIDNVMLVLRELPGCSGIVFEQTCAAEKRRRRKRGLLEDPAKRIFINPLVCEGCGDCSDQSNCIAVEPFETEFGRKRKINQSSCNKDYSCLKGFCPSFVTVDGGELVKTSVSDGDVGENWEQLPQPKQVDLAGTPYNIAVTGVGGTGVLTIGAIIGMATHIEGRACMILDVSGLAQKGGSVISHVRIAEQAQQVTSPRIVTGSANLLIAADNVVASSLEGVVLCSKEHTQAIVNSHLTPVAGFVIDRDFNFRHDEVNQLINDNVKNNPEYHDFSKIAETLLGDSITTNILMLGYILQRGLLPVTPEAVYQAIELNNVAVELNKSALDWGRRLAHSPQQVMDLVQAQRPQTKSLAMMTLDEVIEHRCKFLQLYQGKKLVKRYQSLLNKVSQFAQDNGLGSDIVRVVAINYAKLLAYKDEYEVARLYIDGDFEKRLQSVFTGDYELKFHLSVPIFHRKDNLNRPKKSQYGSWVIKLFGLLAKLRWLRGTPLDPFGYDNLRRSERKLVSHYRLMVEKILPNIKKGNIALAQDILNYPFDIRGYGPVKQSAIEKAVVKREKLLNRFYTTLETHSDEVKSVADDKAKDTKQSETSIH